MRKTLSDKGVAALKPRATRYSFPIPSCAAISSAFSRMGQRATSP